MGLTLIWRPLAEGTDLPDELRRVLEAKYRTHWPIRISRDEWGYFEGLRDAKISGAAEVLDLIEKHGELELDLTS